MHGSLPYLPLVMTALGASYPSSLTNPLVDALGHDRYQKPQQERVADPYSAGPLGPSRWSLLPPLAPPGAPVPFASLALLIASGESPIPRLTFAAFQAEPAPRCRRRPATLVRFGGESETLHLVECDGSVLESTIEHLSVLARPPGVQRPPLPLPDTPESTLVTEWVDQIRLLPPRLAVIVQRIAEAFPYRPIYLISGYRPGSGHGFHAHGQALDLFVMNVSNERVYKLCRRMNDVGCGYYPNNKFVHIDVRPPGTGKAYWIDTSAPGEPSNYVDSWPGVEAGGAAVWKGGP
ncbi:MAG: D-Ala-D-Ala carboxypeptidase family metallohydrolase [Polyangiaceae bacterium]|nr:D-Ala-D-Ala carboxypeptidase family metallohydrolase [Polyangiaceae bacterium]